MFYGFGVSPYLYMMRKNGMSGDFPGATPPIAEEEPHRRSWRDALLPESYAGEDVPDDVAHQARARGLGALGQALLRGSSTGDWGGALAEGFAGFSEARDSTLERNRVMGMQRSEEERQKAAEARAQAQEADRSRIAPVQQQAAEAELENYREKQQQGRELRARTGKSADQMVAEINSLAAANPDDETLQRMAKRAAGYALGEDSDLNSLAKLHDDMTTRAGRDDDAAWKTKTEIGIAQEQGKHGYGTIAEGSRAERGLSLEAERNQFYGRQTDKQFDRDPNVKPASWYDDVNKEIDALVKPTLEGRMKNVGEMDFSDPNNPRRIQPPSQDEIDRLRRSVEKSAIENVNRRNGLYPSHGGVGGGLDVSGARDGNEVMPRNRAPEANHARNLAVESLLAGHSEDEVLDAIPDSVGGYTRTQIIESAKQLAHHKGWRREPKRAFPMPTGKDNWFGAASDEEARQYWDNRKRVTADVRKLAERLPGGADVDGIVGRTDPGSAGGGVDIPTIAWAFAGHEAERTGDRKNPSSGLDRASVAARETLRTHHFSPENIRKLRDIGLQDPTQILSLPIVMKAMAVLPSGPIRARASQEAIRMARDGFSERQIINRLTGGTGRIETETELFYFDEDGNPVYKRKKEGNG